MKDGRKPQDSSGFSVMVMILCLLLTSPMVFLGCGSTEPPPGEPQKAGPSVTGEPAAKDAGIKGDPVKAKGEIGGQQNLQENTEEIITRGGRPKPSQPDQADAIERFISNMQLGNIAFNAPSSINLNEDAVIHLVLGLKKSIDDLKQMVEAEGEKQGASIKVSNKMVAQLKGANFKINAITPEKQIVTPNEVTEWKWEVKPTSSGRQKLFLTLSAEFTVNGEATSKLVRTFDKTIEVNVTFGQRATDLFDKYGQWLWATIIVPVVGWFWKRRKDAQAKKKAEPTESDQS